MRFKKYQVSDMKEAMKVIKDDLGPDAIILSTKPIMKHKNLGLLAKPAIEVIATADYKSANADKPQPQGSYPPPKRSSLDIRVDDDVVESYRPLSFDTLNDKRRGSINRNTKPEKYQSQSDLLADLASHTLSDVEDHRAINIAEFPPIKRRTIDNYEHKHSIFSGRNDKTNTQTNNRLGQFSDDKFNTLIEEISVIKKQLSDIKSSSSPVVSLNISDRLKDFYGTLCKSGVDEVIAYRLLRDFEKIISDNYSNIQIKNLLIDELSEFIDIERDYNGLMRNNVMAFVGPTGVGKTTTVAKIAANLKLKDRKSVALITIDSYRIGAVEQLKTYAEIVDMPLYVASSPNELKTLINDLRKSYDNVLVDTMGRSQFDAKEIELLCSFFKFDSSIVVSLLLSLSSNHVEMIDTLDRYSVLNPQYLILTKLDETKYFGPLINIPFKKKLPLLLLTTGQNVPDDIETPDGKKIAKKLLQDIPTLWGDGRY